jgi:hypothetical protein
LPTLGLLGRPILHPGRLHHHHHHPLLLCMGKILGMGINIMLVGYNKVHGMNIRQKSHDSPSAVPRSSRRGISDILLCMKPMTMMVANETGSEMMTAECDMGPPQWSWRKPPASGTARAIGIATSPSVAPRSRYLAMAMMSVFRKEAMIIDGGSSREEELLPRLMKRSTMTSLTTSITTIAIYIVISLMSTRTINKSNVNRLLMMQSRIATVKTLRATNDMMIGRSIVMGSLQSGRGADCGKRQKWQALLFRIKLPKQSVRRL